MPDAMGGGSRLASRLAGRETDVGGRSALVLPTTAAGPMYTVRGRVVCRSFTVCD